MPGCSGIHNGSDEAGTWGRQVFLSPKVLRRPPKTPSTGANLREVNLDWAILERANLSGATLLDANLSRANLKGANLEGAVLPDGTVHE